MQPVAGIIPQILPYMDVLMRVLDYSYISAPHALIQDVTKPYQLNVYRDVTGKVLLGTYWAHPDGMWFDDGAFVFIDPL